MVERPRGLESLEGNLTPNGVFPTCLVAAGGVSFLMYARPLVHAKTRVCWETVMAHRNRPVKRYIVSSHRFLHMNTRLIHLITTSHSRFNRLSDLQIP